MKAVHHGLVPALHSAAEQSVQRPSGHWQAHSLALSSRKRTYFFIKFLASGWELEKKLSVHSDQGRMWYPVLRTHRALPVLNFQDRSVWDL
jgi:hypothetical protein